MPIQFQHLDIKAPDLFGVSLTGSVSRSDKTALQELAQQAMSRNKVNLILDLSHLTSLGGSGARVLAEFQRELIAVDGEAVFSGVGTVVRRFLDGKFDNLPLRYFLNVDDAIRDFHNDNYSAPDHSALLPAAPLAQPEATVDSGVEPTMDSNEEVGAMSFNENEDDEEADSGLDDLLGEFTGKEARKGRRKTYHYTSLTDAISALGTWHNGNDPHEFSEALTNLLFSHGLADQMELFFPSGIYLRDVNDDIQIPLAGSLARQLVDYARPLSILDLHPEDLLESETKFLEQMNPDLILPLLHDRQLIGMVLLSNTDKNREYSVGENFAFELLMQVLGGAATEADGSTGEQATASGEELVEVAKSVAPAANSDTPVELNETLYHLALELPDADDRPHFWRTFFRHVYKIMPMDELAFLSPNGSRPHIMAGNGADWMGLDLGQERLQMFFRSLERPVKVANLPSLFKETKEKMIEAGVDWLISLHWEEEYQGMVLLSGKLEEMEMFPEERLMQLFEPTGRMLARFDGHNDDADITQGLVQTLMKEREIRCYGSDDVTSCMVNQLERLAGEMGFPPDQHRNLVYGCLFRDLGLVGQSDELMIAPDKMTPEQLQIYYKHPERGRDLLSERDLPATIIEVVSCHHERFNGQGYPEGLTGKEIPLAARVVTVVENYVAMIKGVGHPEPMSADEAAKAMREDDGGRFDPDIVTVFLQAVSENNKELVPTT